MYDEIKFNEITFDLNMQKLVGKRFESISDIDAYIEKEFMFNPKLEEIFTDPELKLDYQLYSNCTVLGQDLCYLDIYYTLTRDKKMYIIEVNCDFNT